MFFVLLKLEVQPPSLCRETKSPPFLKTYCYRKIDPSITLYRKKKDSIRRLLNNEISKSQTLPSPDVCESHHIFYCPRTEFDPPRLSHFIFLTFRHRFLFLLTRKKHYSFGKLSKRGGVDRESKIER